jgi:hypothetical protein
MFVVLNDTKISKAYNSGLYAKSKKLANPGAFARSLMNAIGRLANCR